MPTDDREPQFERALARHLRESSDAACADAEILAAYHERTLSLEEMAKWKEHIAACARCQEALALVEESEGVEAEDWKKEGVVVRQEQDLAVAKRVITAASAPVPLEKALKGKKAVLEALKKRPGAQWKWILPVGAIAASVIVWIGVHEVRDQEKESSAAVETAQNRPPAGLQGVPADKVEEKRQEAESAKKMTRDQTKEFAEPRAAAPAPAPTSGETGRIDEASRASKMVAPGAKEELDAKSKKDAQVTTGFGQGDGTAAPAAAPPPAPAGAMEKSKNEVAVAPNQGGVGGGELSGGAAGAKQVAGMSADTGRSTATSPGRARKTAKGPGSTITGTVVDPSGAAVSGATVVAVNERNGQSQTAVADASGNFQLKDLPTDQYRVIVAQSGFARSEQTVAVGPENNEKLQVQLALGATSQAVEVQAAAPPMNTSTAELSQPSSNAISELPMQGRASSQLLKLAASNASYIVAPDRKAAWRVGEGGRIEHTTDNGKTWKTQSAGVSGDLRTGSATSSKVCWVVGKAGTILLTTDGGKHWKQIASPIAEDLGGIHATDAQHASIWDISNGKSFETTDGGVTWTRKASE